MADENIISLKDIHDKRLANMTEEEKATLKYNALHEQRDESGKVVCFCPDFSITPHSHITINPPNQSSTKSESKNET